MKKERASFLAIIIGGILFNLVFWQEKMALNTLIYDAFLYAFLFYLYPEARRSSTVRWLTLGHLICLAMIIVNNTVLSKIGCMITLGLIVGFSEHMHRSAWYAGGSAILNGIFVPASLTDSFQVKPRPGTKNRSFWKYARLAIIPILFAIIFYLIYSSANNIFSDFSSRITNWISNTFTNFFEVISWKRFFFFIAGLYLTSWILLKSKLNFFEKKEMNCKDELLRKRVKTENKKDLLEVISENLMGRFGKGMMALKNMNTVGLISLLLLNILLLVVNIIDMTYIWFGFEYTKDVDLYKMIHQGTDMLIISILLAMSIVIIFFRGNLNFYRRNNSLKYASYAWLIQNSILVISVLIRDYYYINQTGLAYKRIGVLFYLVLVLVGLVTTFWKIYKKKTTYFLFRVNAWAVVVLMVSATTVNWDELIASYNFSHSNKILMPVDYMVTLSNKALPLLEKHADILEDQIRKQKQLGFPSTVCEGCVRTKLLEKQIDFTKEQESLTWLSFNLADAAIKEYYLQPSKLSSK